MTTQFIFVAVKRLAICLLVISNTGLWKEAPGLTHGGYTITTEQKSSYLNEDEPETTSFLWSFMATSLWSKQVVLVNKLPASNERLPCCVTGRGSTVAMEGARPYASH